MPHRKHLSPVMYSHNKREAAAWFESSVWRHCCWFDAQAVFKSSKSFFEIVVLFCCWINASKAAVKSSKSLLEIQVALFCCWFDSRTFFTFSKSSLMTFTAFKSSLISQILFIPRLKRFTASSNVEDSHDVLSPPVDCAPTSGIDSIVPPITATTNDRHKLFSPTFWYNCKLGLVGVCYLKFKGNKGVATTTKFRQNMQKIAHILVRYKIWGHFYRYDRVFGIGELKYAIHCEP